MPRALILSYHFYPSREVGAKRISELARRLRDSGWQVTVITAPHEPVLELMARIQGIEIVAVAPPAKLYPKIAALWRRLRGAGKTQQSSGKEERAAKPAERSRWRAPLRWLQRHYNAFEWIIDDKKLWSFRVLRRALSMGRQWEWIISSGPPLSIHLSANVLARRYHLRWLMDLRDPWIGNGIWPDHIKSALRDRIEARIERNCLRRADWITVTSPGIRQSIVTRLPSVANKLQVVLNGYDGEPLPSSSASGYLRLLYAGTLYLNRNPLPLLQAFHHFANSPSVDRTRISFTLVGNCNYWRDHDIAAWVAAHQLNDCVRVLPPVSAAEVSAMMRSSEVLVNFAQGQPDQIPAKLYDYIASNREMLLIAEPESDAARITRESGAGRIVEPNDESGMQAVLRELYEFYVVRGESFKPKGAPVESFSRSYQNARFLGLLAASKARG